MTTVDIMATTVALRDYVDERFAAERRALELAQAVLLERLSGLNDLKEAQRESASFFMTKPEHEAYVVTILDYMHRNDADIRSLRENSAESKGKADQSSVTRVATFAIIGIAMSLVSLSCGGIGLLLALFSAFEVASR